MMDNETKKTHDGIAGITTDEQTNAIERRNNGEFVRGVSTARNFVIADTAVTDTSGSDVVVVANVANDTDSNSITYTVESGRYHLYVAYNCPWCHRVILGRAIMGLIDHITMDVCFPNRSNDDEPMGPNLWKFAPNGVIGMNGQHVQFPSCTSDTVLNKTYIKEIYVASNIHDQTSVPILFDKKTKTVVNNESSEILRMFGTVFQSISTTKIDLYPQHLSNEINTMNDWIYTDIANGAYKAGFSSNQMIYETAYTKFFTALSRINDILSKSKFLVSTTSVTEADIRLFPTLYRFDPIYYNRFKLNHCMLYEYKHIWRWMGDIIQLPNIEDYSINTEYLQHCKQGYYGRTGNGTIPIGPPGYPECYRTTK